MISDDGENFVFEKRITDTHIFEIAHYYKTGFTVFKTFYEEVIVKDIRGIYLYSVEDFDFVFERALKHYFAFDHYDNCLYKLSQKL